MRHDSLISVIGSRHNSGIDSVLHGPWYSIRLSDLGLWTKLANDLGDGLLMKGQCSQCQEHVAFIAYELYELLQQVVPA